jgi:hypothetical protein
MDASRPTFCHPFTRGKWTYATDGRIAVRVPALEGIPQGEVAVENVFTAITSQEFPLPADIPEPAQEKCSACKGYGKITICSECDGEGTKECDTCGHEEECKSCNGNGTRPTAGPNAKECDNCDGIGHTIKYISIRLELQSFSDRYLRLIRALPGIRLFQNVNPGDIATFSFDGGEGVLMPLRRD